MAPAAASSLECAMEPVTQCPLCGRDNARTLFEGYDDRHGYGATISVRYCSSCDFTFLAMKPEARRIPELYETYYAGHTESISHVGSRRSALHSLIYWLIGDPHPVRRARVTDTMLDVGCGAGFTLATASAMGSSVVGIDPNRQVCRELRSQGYEVFPGTLLGCPHLEGRTFSMIVMDQVIEHCGDPVAEFVAAKQFLAPGGTLVVATPNLRSILRSVFRSNWIQWHIPYHLCLFSPASLRRAAHLAGLKVTSCRNITPSSWLLSQLVFRRPARGTVNHTFRLEFPVWVRALVGPIARLLDILARGEVLLAELAPM